MVDDTRVLLVAFAILLAAFPLLSYGTTQDATALWWLGIALLIVGGLIPTITRYAFDDEDEENGEADGGDGDGSDGIEDGESKADLSDGSERDAGDESGADEGDEAMRTEGSDDTGDRGDGGDGDLRDRTTIPDRAGSAFSMSLPLPRAPARSHFAPAGPRS